MRGEVPIDQCHINTKLKLVPGSMSHAYYTHRASHDKKRCTYCIVDGVCTRVIAGRTCATRGNTSETNSYQEACQPQANSNATKIIELRGKVLTRTNKEMVFLRSTNDVTRCSTTQCKNSLEEQSRGKTLRGIGT